MSYNQQYLVAAQMGHQQVQIQQQQAELAHQQAAQLELGMVSHKMSLITIFGDKHFRQKFIKNLTFFTKKFQQPLILVHTYKVFHH